MGLYTSINGKLLKTLISTPLSTPKWPSPWNDHCPCEKWIKKTFFNVLRWNMEVRCIRQFLMHRYFQNEKNCLSLVDLAIFATDFLALNLFFSFNNAVYQMKGDTFVFLNMSPEIIFLIILSLKIYSLRVGYPSSRWDYMRFNSPKPT